MGYTKYFWAVLVVVAVSSAVLGIYKPTTYFPRSNGEAKVVVEDGVGRQLVHGNYLPHTAVVQWREGDTLDDGGGRGKPLVIHTYHEGKLFPGYEIILDSYLVSQNLYTTKFIHWMGEDWRVSSDPHKRWIVARYAGCPNIEFRLLDHVSLAQGTCFAERPEFLQRQSIQKYGLRDWSNVVRWLLLYNYGGVWIDSDSMALMDFTVLHRADNNSLALVAGRMPGQHKTDYEGGMFNNNFLHLTSYPMRQKIIEVACLFRRVPLGVDKKGIPQFENQVPLVGDDNHTLHVTNHWLFNDGTLKLCLMRDDCYLNPIGLGEVDPAMSRTLDMYAMCEKFRQSSGGYAADFDALLRQKASLQSTDYLTSIYWTKHVWTVHTRAAHCRTQTGAAGVLKYFHELVLQRMFHDPENAPKQPADFLSFDPSEIKREDHLVEFYPLIIAVLSKPLSFESRSDLRALYSRDLWMASDLASRISFRHKLLFIVPYRAGDSRVNALLMAEHHEYKDLILVDPPVSSFASESATVSKDTKGNSFVSSEVKRGLLKILNQFDSHYFLLLFNHDVYFNLRTLYKIIHEASGQSLFDKETKILPFLVTHKSNAASDVDTLTRYNHTTAFRRMAPTGEATPPQAKGAAAPLDPPLINNFLLLSRNNLPVLLGIVKPSNGTDIKPPSRKKKFRPAEIYPGVEEPFDDTQYIYTSFPQTTLTAALRLTNLTVEPLARKVDDLIPQAPKGETALPGSGLLATTPEDFGFVAEPHISDKPQTAQTDKVAFVWAVPSGVAMRQLVLSATSVPYTSVVP